MALDTARVARQQVNVVLFGAYYSMHIVGPQSTMDADRDRGIECIQLLRHRSEVNTASDPHQLGRNPRKRTFVTVNQLFILGARRAASSESGRVPYFRMPSIEIQFHTS